MYRYRIAIGGAPAIGLGALLGFSPISLIVAAIVICIVHVVFVELPLHRRS